jgi:hypothetical protein
MELWDEMWRGPVRWAKDLPPRGRSPALERIALEQLGTSRVMNPQPPGLPSGQTLRQKDFVLRNLSGNHIVYCAIAFVNDRGAVTGEKRRYSYPPDAPVLAANATVEIPKRFFDKSGSVYSRMALAMVPIY